MGEDLPALIFINSTDTQQLQLPPPSNMATGPPHKPNKPLAVLRLQAAVVTETAGDPRARAETSVLQDLPEVIGQYITGSESRIHVVPIPLKWVKLITLIST